MEAGPSTSPPPIRFGVFELDAATGELRKQGFRIRLQGQPVEILRLLLERAGNVVTRQELKDRLWPDGIHVDFDRSVNRAFVKLREALGDDAASPRFIETLPRVGYRFIAPVDAPSRAFPEAAADRAALAEKRTPAPAWLLASFGVVLAVGITLVARSFVPHEPTVVATRPLTHSADMKSGRLLATRTALYFNRQLEGRLDAVRLPISGGEPTVVETPFRGSEVFDVSVDGSELLIGEIPEDPRSVGSSALWIVPAAGGSARRVGDVRAQAAAWSPDGRRIFFVDDGAIAAVSRDGSQRRTILGVSGDPDDLRVSPDGRTVRFDRSTESGVHLWEADVDGAHLRRVFAPIPGVTWECCGTWTADGRAFLFEAGGGGARSNLWIAVGRSTPVPFTVGPMNLETPAVGGDATKIYAIGVQAQGELVRWDAALRRFEPYLGGIPAEGVSFSADGAWVTYTSYPEGVLYRCRIDGSERIALTAPPLRASLPQMSPDGRRIAFTGLSPGRNPELFVVDAAGGAPKRILAEQNTMLPAWSPDSRSLVFSGSLRHPAGVRIIDLATGKTNLLPGSASFSGPFWSHDGRFLIAAATNPSRIVRYDFARQEWSEVIRRPFNYASLSRDDKFVYFDTRWEGDPAVHRVPAAGGTVERVADLRSVRRAAGPAGMWFDLAPDDSPLVLRDTSSRQIYAIDWAR